VEKIVAIGDSNKGRNDEIQAGIDEVRACPPVENQNCQLGTKREGVFLHGMCISILSWRRLIAGVRPKGHGMCISILLGLVYELHFEFLFSQTGRLSFG
jgi:hypothetical protein